MKQRLQSFILWCKPRTEKIVSRLRPWQNKVMAAAQPYQEKARARWESLEKREKNIVAGGAAAVGLLLLYALIWSPLNDHLDNLRQQIQSEKKTAVWMETAGRQIKSLESKQESKSGKSLSRRLNAVQEALSHSPLSAGMSQLAQSSPEEIRCVFEQIDFDTLIAWLIGFTQEQELTLKQASIQKLNNVGLVKAELVFRVS